jgi:hypothetical protein
MLAPTAKLAAGLVGVQVTVAPAGSPVGTQLALAAVLGPLLVQVTVPVTVLPALALAGKPLTAAAMSACGVIGSDLVSVLLLLFGSAVVLPAVVVMFSGPLAGAVNVLVQVMLAPTASGSGTGFGVQLCVAPAGRPVNTQVGAAAALGPALVQVPLTVTLCPASALAGTVVTAPMSAMTRLVNTQKIDCALPFAPAPVTDCGIVTDAEVPEPVATVAPVRSMQVYVVE